MKITRLFLRALLQVIFHLALGFTRSHSQAIDSDSSTEGVWGEWSHWMPCSVKCSTGITVRTRQCDLPLSLPIDTLIASAHKKLVCDGNDKQIRICNTHECPANEENRRDSKCSKFNARVFNGKKYAWESYINPRKRCEVTCKAKGQHFYARLASRAIDGTVCSTTSRAVCIKGICKEVGCDGIVGSSHKLDKCGVCMGDGSTCRTVSGIFTRPQLSPGYTKIITIPAGSTNINITELRQSKNYLAFRTNHDTILNGNNRVFPSGSYKGLGSTIVYKRKTRMCRTQCAFIRGPTNMSSDLMIFGYSRNLGIMYSFNVPTDVKDVYFQDLIARNEQQQQQHQGQQQGEQSASRSSGDLRSNGNTNHFHSDDRVQPTLKPMEPIRDNHLNIDSASIDSVTNNRRTVVVSGTRKESSFDGNDGFSVVLKANAGPNGSIVSDVSSDSELSSPVSPIKHEKISKETDIRMRPALNVTGTDATLIPAKGSDKDEVDGLISTATDRTQQSESNITDLKPLPRDELQKKTGDTLLDTFQQDSNTNAQDSQRRAEKYNRRNTKLSHVRITDGSSNNKAQQPLRTAIHDTNRRQRVRIPTFSQRFTFRERYRALLNAKRSQKTATPAGSSSNGPVVSLGKTSGLRGIVHSKRIHHHRNFNDMRNLAMNSLKSESSGILLKAPVSSTTQPTPTPRVPANQTSVNESVESTEGSIHSQQGETVSQSNQEGSDSDIQSTSSSHKIIHQTPVLTPVQLPPIVHHTRIPDDDETLALGDIPLNQGSRDLYRTLPDVPQGQAHDRHIIPQQPLVGPSGNQVPLNQQSSGQKLGVLQGGPQYYDTQRGTAELSVGKSHVRPDDSLLNSIDNTYSWRVSGFSECTTTCGGGVQQTTVVCMDMRSQAVVTDENCVYIKRPAPQAVTCNTRPCPAKWAASAWSSCSATCGPGVETRNVVCRSRVSQTLKITMADESCSDEEKPATRRTCQLTTCHAWRVGNFSECDVSCGQGVRERSVVCVTSDQEEASDKHCSGLKPATEEICDMGSCGKGWYHTQWPEDCPAACGTGVQKRRIHCAGEEGEVLPLSRCDKDDRPEAERKCRVSTPCGGIWFTGEWQRCNATCGIGYKTRSVTCVKQLPGGILAVVGDENCKGSPKPETGSECQLPPCQPEWYMTSWSQCSKSCGSGYKTREVKCLDHDQHPSAACDPGNKPKGRETCNTRDCSATTQPKPTSKPLKNTICKDSFSQCVLVKKARLCRFNYYSKMCCQSCSEAT